jgi:hypothetical protein
MEMRLIIIYRPSGNNNSNLLWLIDDIEYIYVLLFCSDHLNKLVYGVKFFEGNLLSISPAVLRKTSLFSTKNAMTVNNQGFHDFFLNNTHILVVTNLQRFHDR